MGGVWRRPGGPGEPQHGEIGFQLVFNWFSVGFQLVFSWFSIGFQEKGGEVASKSV
jgi:hypothetical protein